mmetsp:Transcript_33776/g.71007  ORF Transcript_33776/g.71007 Transcript_33776/m.71007 type:complete len:385 (-) Transcript_33776:740-1894(-)
MQGVRKQSLRMGRIGLHVRSASVHQPSFLRSIAVGCGFLLRCCPLGKIFFVQRRELLVPSQLLQVGEFTSADDANGLPTGSGLDFFARTIIVHNILLTHFLGTFRPLVQVLRVLLVRLRQCRCWIVIVLVTLERLLPSGCALADQLGLFRRSGLVEGDLGAIALLGRHWSLETDGDLLFRFGFLRVSIRGMIRRGRGFRRSFHHGPRLIGSYAALTHYLSRCPRHTLLLPTISIRSISTPCSHLKEQLHRIIIPKITLFLIGIIQLGLGIVEKIAGGFIEHSRSSVEDKGRARLVKGGWPLSLFGLFLTRLFVARSPAIVVASIVGIATASVAAASPSRRTVVPISIINGVSLSIAAITITIVEGGAPAITGRRSSAPPSSPTS